MDLVPVHACAVAHLAGLSRLEQAAIASWCGSGLKGAGRCVWPCLPLTMLTRQPTKAPSF